MEFVIPFVALGGMYVVSNQKKKYRPTESYSNMNQPLVQSAEKYPVLETYPVANPNKVNVDEIQHSNTVTDKYFNQSVFNDEREKNAQTYSLTGKYVEIDKFKHNNMVPFNGKKVKGQLYNIKGHENVLDNMNGSGSQYVRKIEQAPLFKPDENVQWANGAPNQSDFFQSRVNPGMMKKNVKPFESEMVGPGLNQGFNSAGTGGFNSGMESRDMWMPKNIDQLRVDTNPKIEYELAHHEGPANSVIKQHGFIGRVEKQQPDTYFEQDPARWLTTTGSSKGETMRPNQEMGILRRNDVAINYPGPAGNADVKAAYVPSNYESSKRTQLSSLHVKPSTAVGSGPVDHRYIESHTNHHTHRSKSKQPDSFRSGFSGAIGAVVAPLMDLLRPTRKEEGIQSVRIYGEAGSTVPQNYVINPSDITPTTIKETTLYSPEFNVNGQRSSVYVDTHRPMVSTQRETTTTNYVGGLGNKNGEMVNQINRTQNNTKSATIQNRMAPGNMDLFNSNINVELFKKDTTPYDNRVTPGASIVPHPVTKENYGKSIHRHAVVEDRSRYDENLLTAFKANPYTHSLSSVA
jgi:hypothetical protein